MVNKKLATLAVAALLALAPSAHADWEKKLAVKLVERYPIDLDGVVTIDNAVGMVTVTGTNGGEVVVEMTRNTAANDDRGMRQAIERTRVAIGGNNRQRLFKTMGAGTTPVSASTMDYHIHVPRSIRVDILSGNARIRVTDLTGELHIRNVAGKIELRNVTGLIDVNSANASIFAFFPKGLSEPARLETINGGIEVRVPKNARFQWVSETVAGDILSGFPVRDRPVSRMGSNVLQTAINAPGPTLQTRTVGGRIYLMPIEDPRAFAQSLIAGSPTPRPAQQDIRQLFDAVVKTFPLKPAAETFVVQEISHDGDYSLDADLGNVFVGLVRGSARVQAKGGEVILGTVLKTCWIRSMGGPLYLQDVYGDIDARTSAGDIGIASARSGGTLSTNGGNVKVKYSGGPLSVDSGGGDVTVSRAAGPVRAVTKSGDISINVDRRIQSQNIEARSGDGNISLNLPVGFAADIDATVLTSNDATSRIESDFPGLTIVRQRVGEETRIHATGKINGGGQRLLLYTEDGNIRLNNLVPSR